MIEKRSTNRKKEIVNQEKVKLINPGVLNC